MVVARATTEPRRTWSVDIVLLESPKINEKYALRCYLA